MGILIQTEYGELWQGVSSQRDIVLHKGQVKDSLNMWHGVEDTIKRRPPANRIGDALTFTNDGEAVNTVYNPDSKTYFITFKTGLNSYIVRAIGGATPSGFVRSSLSTETVGEGFTSPPLVIPLGLSTFVMADEQMALQPLHPFSQPQKHTFTFYARNLDVRQTQTLTIRIRLVNRTYTYKKSYTAGSSGALRSEVFNALAPSTDSDFIDDEDPLLHLPDNLLIFDDFDDNVRVCSQSPSTSGEVIEAYVEGSDSAFGCRAYANNVPDTTWLPQRSKEGDGFAIFIGEGDSGYWVKYDDTSKLWVEAANPNTNNEVEAVIWESRPDSNQFPAVAQSAHKVSLSQREAGGLEDDSTTPKIFVDEKVKDIFTYKGRLGFLTDFGMYFSQVSDINNFFPTSATEVLDTDPFSVVFPSPSGSAKYVVPFRDTLFVLGDERQYELKSQGGLTPQNAQLDLATSYQASIAPKPVVVGSRLYFVENIGGFSRVWEYYFDEATVSNTAQDISLHAASFIETMADKPITHISGHTANNFVFLSSDKSNVIYCYKSAYNGNEKIQSSWSRWEFGAEGSKILHQTVVGDKLLLAVELSNTVGGIVFGEVDLDPDYHKDGKVIYDYVDFYEDPVNPQNTTSPYTSRLVLPTLYPYFRGDSSPITEGRGRLRKFTIDFATVGEATITAESKRGGVKTREYTIQDYGFGEDKVGDLTPYHARTNLTGNVEDIQITIETKDNKPMDIIKFDTYVYYNSIPRQDQRGGSV